MTLHDDVRTWYLQLDRAMTHNRLMDYKWFVEQELNTWGHPMRLPFRERLEIWRHGFTSPCGKLYDVDRWGLEAFLSELQRNRLFDAMNGRHRYLIDDKLSQYWMLADHPEHRPTAYGFIDRGYVHGVAGTAFDDGPMPVDEWLPPALRERSKLVLKHLRGKGGKEVHICGFDDGFTFDDRPVSEAELCERVGRLSAYLVSAFVEQHAYADALYPHAANTVRLFTLWDDEAGELYTPIAVQRVGTERSRPVDNFAAGGVSAEIDLETGELGRAAQFPFDGRAVPWYRTHPDTGAPLEGETVARWDRIRDVVETLARENTHIPAIGWDILLDSGGEPVVLEANTGTTFDLLQVHRPLLADDRLATIAARFLPDLKRVRDPTAAVVQ